MKNRLILFLLLASTLSGAAVTAAGQNNGTKSRDRMTPVQLGDTAPDFTLTDANGRAVTLSKLGKTVVLVFYRGYW